MYFAKLNENNIVTDVIVADSSFIEGIPGIWIETDINGISPKNYAGIGYSYNEELNAFIPPKPFNSWIFNEATCTYNPPISMPTDSIYKWDEENLTWVNLIV